MKKFCEGTVKKLYFTPKEVAEMLHEKSSTIWWWATQYGVKERKTKSSHDAMNIFTMKDVAAMHVIKNLIRVEKFTPEGVRQKLKITKI